MPALEAHALSRRFGERFALSGLTFAAEAGEVVALLGPNGAGKTTTVRLLNGILAPDGGASRVLGLDPVVDGQAIRRRTGVVTENAALDDRLTALDNVVFYARIRGLSPADANRRANAQLERLGVGARAGELVRGFSTGLRKRVALARALVHEPEVLFLDEPTAGLDPEAARDTVELIAGLAGGQGRTVVLCTHDLAEAGRLANRMAVLQEGRLVAFGAPAALAASIWNGLAVDLDLGDPAPAATLALLAGTRGVLAAEPAAGGARLRVEGRQVIPAVVGGLAGREVPVYGVTARPPTLEDVYFALTSSAPAGNVTAGNATAGNATAGNAMAGSAT
jgi:ABC-2 type transport system ATP-binding protein